MSGKGDLERATPLKLKGPTRSIWMETRVPHFPTLEADINADVCIVGAGLAGLSCAYALTKEGKSVVIVDQGTIGGGQSSRTTAHLTWVLDDRVYELEKLFGHESARKACESHATAIDRIEEIVKAEKIECDFIRLEGYLFSSPDSDVDLEKEYAAVKKMGMEVEWAKCPLDTSSKCLKFPNQAKFHILKYLNGLTQSILNYGGRVYSHTPIVKVEEHKSGEKVLETLSGKKIKSKSVIIATASPINDRFIIHTKQAPYRSYVIAGIVKKGSIPDALYWDTADPYHYIRLQPHLTNPELEWVVIGGEDHKTGQCDDMKGRYARLMKWAHSHIPTIVEYTYGWSGQVFEPIDGLGFIGKNPLDQNVYIITGDSGNGMTHGTIGSLLITDLILGRENAWKELYDPSRKTLCAAGEFIKESINVALQYRDWFTPGELKKIEDLSLNQGIIVRKGLKKLAVYKDATNRIHVNTATCPHLGACVRWNDIEKGWDCPCHGSQFTGNGKVINGPACENLKPYYKKPT